MRQLKRALAFADQVRDQFLAYGLSASWDTCWYEVVDGDEPGQDDILIFGVSMGEFDSLPIEAPQKGGALRPSAGRSGAKRQGATITGVLALLGLLLWALISHWNHIAAFGKAARDAVRVLIF